MHDVVGGVGVGNDREVDIPAAEAPPAWRATLRFLSAALPEVSSYSQAGGDLTGLSALACRARGRDRASDASAPRFPVPEQNDRGLDALQLRQRFERMVA